MSAEQDRAQLQEVWRLRNQISRLSVPALNETLNFFLAIRSEPPSLQARLTRVFLPNVISKYSGGVLDLSATSYLTQRSIQGATGRFMPATTLSSDSFAMITDIAIQGVMYWLGNNIDGRFGFSSVISGARGEITKGIFGVSRETIAGDSSKDASVERATMLTGEGGGCDFCNELVELGIDAVFHANCQCVLAPQFDGSSLIEPWQTAKTDSSSDSDDEEED